MGTINSHSIFLLLFIGTIKIKFKLREEKTASVFVCISTRNHPISFPNSPPFRFTFPPYHPHNRRFSRLSPFLIYCRRTRKMLPHYPRHVLHFPHLRNRERTCEDISESSHVVYFQGTTMFR